MFIIYDDLSRQTSLSGEQVQLMTDLESFLSIDDPRSKSSQNDLFHPNKWTDVTQLNLSLHKNAKVHHWQFYCELHWDLATRLRGKWLLTRFYPYVSLQNANFARDSNVLS